MRTYALISDNTVVAIEQLDSNDDALMLRKGQQYQNIIDIEDIYPQPKVAWILDGNKLVSSTHSQDAFLLQQQNAREFGMHFAEEITDLIGARNLKLSAEGSTVNVSSVLQQLNVLKALLDTGCLRTVVLMTSAIAPSFPAYSDIFSYAISEVNAFLTKMGY